MLIIQLDNGSLTTGTVIAHALYINEALRYIFSGRDGARVEEVKTQFDRLNSRY